MAAGVIAAAAAAAQKQAHDKADAAWAPYAKSKGYTHRPSRTTPSHTDPARVSGTEDGVSIAFEIANFDGDWGTTAVAMPPAPVAVRLELAPEGIFQKFTKLFGAQDIQVGDAPFDKAYMIKGTDDPAAHLVLCESTRKAMLSLGVATFVYDDGSTKERPAVIIAGIPSLLTTTEQLDRLVAFLVGVAKIHPEKA
jgi:hypothetical protein